ncbi:diguanylate cyclase [Pseudomonas asturiensis]|uniref:Diguanylate cyclase n=1 Tax=Pseudomonas asturiensis TaxID=1190415 RepID=A0ABX6HJK9_9PSED|nr:GGDEF domain-containing protein [Pseudomonas asturiensis]QHF05800.1 diguanylate cyclase [Pseudomonas asturiensis]
MTSPSMRISLLEAAVEQSFNAILITDADVAGGGPFIVYANPEFCSMTGYALEALIGRSPRMLQGADTDPKVIAHLRNCVRENLFFEGSTINYRADGSAYTVEWKISPVRDESGVVSHFVSVQQNVSRRIRAEQEQHLLAQALNVALDPIFITDCSEVIVFANKAFQNVTGYDAAEIIGHTPRIMRSGKHDGVFYEYFKASLRKGKPFRTEFINKRKDGSIFHAEHSISPLHNANGEITHFVSISQDLTQRIGREKQLIEIAHRDPLTGLHNRRAAEHELELHIQRARQSGKPFSLIIGDIDHFKSINDRYGHPIGDRVLKSVSSVLLHRIRAGDLAARWGGEEFLVLVPDISLEQASDLANRIREGVAELVIEEADAVTISLGVAELLSSEAAGALIKRADSSLYKAKRNGRNRVELADKALPTS